MIELYKLIEESQKGDKDSLLTIINKFYPLINKYTNKLNYDGSDTDLVIALIEIVNKLPISKNQNMKKEQCIVGYINTCIKNKYINLSKKSTKIYQTEVELNLNIGIDTSSNYLEDLIEIRILLDSLPKLQKYVIIKKILENYTDVEIATKLCISRQAVNRTKNRAIKNLRKYVAYC